MVKLLTRGDSTGPSPVVTLPFSSTWSLATVKYLEYTCGILAAF